MWRPGSGGAADTVTCVACGETLARSASREYDKHGDRWDRDGKEFEYLCKPCHRELCHQPRGDLESLLVEVGAGEKGTRAFLAWYCAAVEDRYGSLEDRERAGEKS